MDAKEIVEIVEGIKQMNREMGKQFAQMNEAMGNAIGWLLGIVKCENFKAKKMLKAL